MHYQSLTHFHARTHAHTRARTHVPQDLFTTAGSCVVDKTSLGVFYSIVDIVAMCFLICGIWWLRDFERSEIQELDRNTVSPSDFTVYLPWVPEGTTEENLAAFFNCNNKRVQVVHFGYDDGDLIEAFTNRARLSYEKYVLGQQVRYFRSKLRTEGVDIETLEDPEAQFCGSCRALYALNCDKNYNIAKERALIRDRESIAAEINALDATFNAAEGQANWHKPLCAFVSFTEEEGMIQAIEENRRSLVRWLFNLLGCCKKTSQTFLDRYVLSVKQAPAPSTIIWENIKYSSFVRFKKRMVTNVVALVAVFGSVLVSAFVESYKYENLKGDEQACPPEFFDWTTEAQVPEKTTRLGRATQLLCIFGLMLRNAPA